MYSEKLNEKPSENLTDTLKLNRQRWRDLLNGFDWEEAREGVNRESRARVVLLGLPGAGKSSLFNELCGWIVSPPADGRAEDESLGPAGAVEDFGLFCLVDLPAEPAPAPSSVYGDWPPYPAPNGQPAGLELPPGLELEGGLGLSSLDPLELAAGATLLIYLLDGEAGLRAADYRWVGRLRRLGVPLLVVLNKCDRLGLALADQQAQIESRLATTVLPVSTVDDTNLGEPLLTNLINLCPELTVALGRELGDFRQQAATRLIRRAAWLNGLFALEPVPLIDLPLQMMTLTGLMLRLAAVYDRPPSDSRRREIVTAMAGSLAGRYGAQQVAKLVPVVGWLASGLIGWSTTWLLGRATVTYFEAGGDAVVDRGWRRTRAKVRGSWQGLVRRWRQRPRLRLVRPAAMEAEEEELEAAEEIESGEPEIASGAARSRNDMIGRTDEQTSRPSDQ